MTLVAESANGTTMFKALRTHRSSRGTFAALLVFVLALRILVPTGFMPTQTADGIVVTICNGMGDNQTIVIDLQRSDDVGHSDHEKAAEQEPCFFASASLPTLSGDTNAALATPAMLLQEFALPPPVSHAPVSADFLTPPLRGPPALA